MSSKPLRWGIISTGGIATKYAQDLLVDPSTREVSDVKHVITAVGSRNVDSANKFIDALKAAKADEGWSWGVKNGGLENVKGYGSYEEVYADPNVDIVYIGTPHTFHHRNTKDALLAGKHVCCEKPFTLSLEELDELIALAKEKNLFLMEAVWTRFHPIAYKVQEVMKSGKLGKPKRFSADFSSNFEPDEQPYSHRMIDPKLGGGSLLDMGPYPSVWAMLMVHHHPLNKDKTPKVVSSYQSIYKRSGVDASSRWIVEWDGLCLGNLMTDMTTSGFADNTALLQCDKGDLVIENPPYKPSTFHIVPHLYPDEGDLTKRETIHAPVHEGNNGMAYEADECARCIARGEIESKRMPWEESRVVQGWFDTVRNEGGTVLKGKKGTVGE